MSGSQAKVIAIGPYTHFARAMRRATRAKWLGRFPTKPLHDDETGIQAIVQLVLPDTYSVETVDSWAQADKNLTAMFLRVDGKTFGGRVRRFCLSRGVIAMSTSILKSFSEDVPSVGNLVHLEKPRLLILRGENLGREAELGGIEIPMMQRKLPSTQPS